MKKYLFTFIFVSIIQFSFAQETTTLNTIAMATKKCLVKYQDSVNEENEHSFVRECLENATEEHINSIFKYYKIDNIKQLNLKTYVVDMLPYLSKQCNMKEEKLKVAFSKWIK